VIVTVTVNAALDRTLTVPVFHIGYRHRSSDVLTLVAASALLIAIAALASALPARRALRVQPTVALRQE